MDITFLIIILPDGATQSIPFYVITFAHFVAEQNNRYDTHAYILKDECACVHTEKHTYHTYTQV